MINEMQLSSPKISKALSSVQFYLSPKRKQELFEILRKTYKKAGQTATVNDLPNSVISEIEKYLNNTDKNFQIQVTKRQMNELPSYPKVEAVSKKHSKAIQVALAAGISGVGSAIAQALRAVPKPLEDAAQMKAVAQGAVRSNVLMNNAKAVNVLKDIYTAGSYAGAVDAAQVVRSDAVLAGKGLQNLLDKAGITIQGINDTTMTRISDSLLLGISQGMSARDIGTAIDLIINDPNRADIIAVTETNRAYNASAVDTYQSAGIEQFDWLAYDGACAECLDQELANPHDITDDYPPEHPSCRCTVAAVLPDTSTSTGE